MYTIPWLLIGQDSAFQGFTPFQDIGLKKEYWIEYDVDDVKLAIDIHL